MIKNNISVVFHETGQLISALHQRDFPDRLLNFIATGFAFDHALILAYHGKSAPVVLHKSYHANRAENSLPEYLQTAYLLDPVFSAHLAGLENGLHLLKEIAPDRFHNTAYYNSYYTKTGYTDEVVLSAQNNTEQTLTLSLFKQSQQSPNFGRRQLAGLRELSPVICAALQQHWNNFAPDNTTGASDDRSDPLSQRIIKAIKQQEDVSLTDRQAEIVALTLRGHSATSISLNLSISPETVKVHRRNIYSRLRISSQSQLFSLVISATGPLST